MQGLHVYQPKPVQYLDIEALIPKNHILRKIDKLLDLSFVRELTAQYYCYNIGRPSIDPELFFRMILVGYIFGIRYDRKLCEEITYNLAYRWYCKLNLDQPVPDHSTLSKIRNRYGSEVFEEFFHKVVDLCFKAGLVKGEQIITDSTLIEANASLDSLVSKESDVTNSQSVGDVAKQYDKKLSNQTHISKTDPDSSLAKKPNTPKGLKYKAHISIDGDSRVILDNKITTCSCHETQTYLERLKYIENKYHFVIKEVIADKAYGAADNIQSLYERDIIPYIPLFSSRSGQVVQLESLGFSFDQENNRYICPEGKLLLPYERGESSVYKSKSSDCINYSRNTECSASLRKCSAHIRHIYRSHKQSFYEAEQHKMNTDLFKSKLYERMWKIEGINTEAKNLHSLKRAKYRGLTNMQIQAYMIGVVLNLKRLIQAYVLIIIIEYFCILVSVSLIQHPRILKIT